MTVNRARQKGNLAVEISYKDIILRDYQEADIEDNIRWMTVEIAWQDWDAPWEKDDEFDAEKYRAKCLERLKQARVADEFRWSFQIDTKDGVHIGAVNSYLIDKAYNWVPGRKGKGFHTLGIDICESSYWYQGYGTQAFTAFILYHISRGITDVFVQTWSGNLPMIGLAEKLGFKVVQRIKDHRLVRGSSHDGLTFKLNMDEFMETVEKVDQSGFGALS